MATAIPMNGSPGLERRPASSTRSRPDTNRPSTRVSMLQTEENRAPPVLPKAFQSMLKTTTETGNIGMFSIKPPRVPHPPSSPRRMQGAYGESGSQSSQRPRNYPSYGPSGVDDRRRLPSYVRDASSEIISMYETPSQKSANRGYDESDYRSYSMNQGYSQYALHNHRSYSSLRSQPEGSGHTQRPRSPFAYPARLRRPGFRPSSPALTDGGVVDYSRRAEIDRGTYAPRANSPSPLYAQKRYAIPLPLRSNANRSMQSLLSQSPSSRRSPSPYMRQDEAVSTPDWSRRNMPASINSSPARSILSLASTINLYHTASAVSTATTPGKLHPPSPLYYDYTEDFDVGDYNRPPVLEPPPQFRIERTIPEDRPLSANWQGQEKGTSDRKLRHSSENSTVIHHKSNENWRSSVLENVGTSETIKAQQIANHALVVQSENDVRDKKATRVSVLGPGAQELNRNVLESFGLAAVSSFELLNLDTRGESNATESVNSADASNGNIDLERSIESQSIRTSGYSFNTHLRQFPPPPLEQPPRLGAEIEHRKSRASSDTCRGRRLSLPPQHALHSLNRAGSYLDGTIDGNVERRSSTSSRKRSSRSLSMDVPDEVEPKETAHGFEEALVFNGTQSPEVTSQLIPSVPGEAPKPLGQSNTPAVQQVSIVNQASIERIKHFPELPTTLTHHPSKKRRVETMSEPSCGDADVPNFSHQFPRRLISRSDSPMLAPKPISPARQLKLKNSIPQLMKALPAVPKLSEKRVQEVTSLQYKTGSVQPSFSNTSPPLPNNKSAQSYAERVSTKELEINVEAVATSKIDPAELDSKPISPVSTILEEEIEQNPHTPRLKLKMRNSTTPHPTSAKESRSWNFEECYPWSDQKSATGIPQLTKQGEDLTASVKQPKFKLKITRASGSTIGTVRVNRGSSESRSATGLQLRSPTDLFSSTSGIDVFSSISRHLHSRKSSVNSNTLSADGTSAEFQSINSTQTLQAHHTYQSTIAPIVTQPTLLPTPTQNRSFFSDDSEHNIEKLNIRKRMSNFRARITTPYMARNAAQSYDDLTWRDRNRPQVPSPSPARSNPDLRGARMDAETDATKPGDTAGNFRGHNIRTKVIEWLKGARLAIKTRVRLRKGIS